MIDDTRVLVVRDPLPLAEVRSVSLEREESSHLAWLADGGRELVLATGDGRWIFLWVVDVERHTVRERVSLRIPGSSGEAFLGSRPPAARRPPRSADSSPGWSLSPAIRRRFMPPA